MTAPKFSDLECGKIRNMFAIVEDMKKLHATCCKTYDDPNTDEEHKRWALYTGTCIQGLMDGNHINELFKQNEFRETEDEER